ncbi:hypothetical protein GCM10022223_04860 [Kineosporia mesophila]|uniref:Uncharacterized protein n=1 Tax=Kineosporia mesophila TaxID=566012 RepID=A0ABP6YWN1_9ACTN|nr:hypothetical protein [Kineosporia mesophila]MCD5354303.1 hypothetical protein [Kineosporia mesophila]
MENGSQAIAVEIFCEIIILGSIDVWSVFGMLLLAPALLGGRADLLHRLRDQPAKQLIDQFVAGLTGDGDHPEHYGNRHPLLVMLGDQATRRPGDQATRRPGDQATRIATESIIGGPPRWSRSIASFPCRPALDPSSPPAEEIWTDLFCAYGGLPWV